MYICERPGKVREPLADEFLGRERVTDAKGTRLACDSAVERFENIVEGPSLWHAFTLHCSQPPLEEEARSDIENQINEMRCTSHIQWNLSYNLGT